MSPLYFVLIFFVAMIILPVYAVGTPVNLSNSEDFNAYNQMVVLGENVYVVWGNVIGEPKIEFTSSHNSGDSWNAVQTLSPTVSEYSYISQPQVAAQGDNVYVIWNHEFDGIGFVWSNNKGIDFSEPVLLTPMGACTYPHYDSPNIAMSGNIISITFVGLCNQPAAFHTYFMKSTDGGQSFSDEIILSESGHTITTQTSQIAFSGNNIYVSWVEADGSNHKIFFSASYDQGNSFGSATEITTFDLYPFAPELSMDATGDNVYIVWHGRTDTLDNDIFFRKSSDSGNSFDEIIQITDTTASFHPAIKANGNNVHLVWRDQIGLVDDVTQYSRSLDGGNNFLNSISFADAGRNHEPQVAIEDDLVAIVWADSSSISQPPFFAFSENSGESFGNPIQLGDSSDYNVSFNVEISCGKLYAVWKGSGEAAADIFFNSALLDPDVLECPSDPPSGPPIFPEYTPADELAPPPTPSGSSGFPEYTPVGEIAMPSPSTSTSYVYNQVQEQLEDTNSSLNSFVTMYATEVSNMATTPSTSGTSTITITTPVFMQTIEEVDIATGNPIEEIELIAGSAQVVEQEQETTVTGSSQSSTSTSSQQPTIAKIDVPNSLTNVGKAVLSLSKKPSVDVIEESIKASMLLSSEIPSSTFEEIMETIMIMKERGSSQKTIKDYVTGLQRAGQKLTDEQIIKTVHEKLEHLEKESKIASQLTPKQDLTKAPKDKEDTMKPKEGQTKTKKLSEMKSPKELRKLSKSELLNQLSNIDNPEKKLPSKILKALSKETLQFSQMSKTVRQQSIPGQQIPDLPEVDRTFASPYMQLRNGLLDEDIVCNGDKVPMIRNNSDDKFGGHIICVNPATVPILTERGLATPIG